MTSLWTMKMTLTQIFQMIIIIIIKTKILKLINNKKFNKKNSKINKNNKFLKIIIKKII